MDREALMAFQKLDPIYWDDENFAETEAAINAEYGTCAVNAYFRTMGVFDD